MSFKNDAKNTGKFSLLVVLAVVIVVGGIGGFKLFGDRFVKPFQEETRFQTQQESSAYREGIQRRLSTMYVDYQSADAGGKTDIVNIMRHEFGLLNSSHIDAFPAHLKDFLRVADIY